MRALHRARPDVDVALLVVAAVEREGVRMLPGLHHQVVRLVVALAKLRRVLAVGEAVVHRRADRESRDQPAAGDAVDHRELFCDAGRRIVQCERVAHHADGGVGGAAGERRGDQVRRRHQAVAVGVVLVDADRVVAARGGVFQLVHEVVVHVVRAAWVEQRGVDVHPYRRMLLAEVIREFGVGHQVEPHELHDASVSRVVLLPQASGNACARGPQRLAFNTEDVRRATVGHRSSSGSNSGGSSWLSARPPC